MKFRFSDENTILERCLAQDKKAWDVFVDRYNRLIYNAIVQTLNKYSFPIENQIVDDLFQTVFLSLIEYNYKKLRQFQGKCKLSGWLHIIAVRITIDFLRKKSISLSLNGETEQERSIKESIANGNPLPDEVIDQEEEKIIFDKVKSELKTKEQLFIELYYNREFSSVKVAKIMNITPNNVYQIKSRVREKMRTIVKKYYKISQ
jgi:RNA polymerase sigma factor (sigma-70 family)